MSGLVYGSVCSGIEAATVAWHPLGWAPAFFSEIEAFPRAVLAHHYPEVPLHGDFTSIQAGQYRPIDLLVGGTPCQSFSIAGLRGGLDDDRGNLALEYLRLADRLRPRWLVWENVPGVLSSNGGRDFGSILGGMGELGYGVAYRVLDAQFFGLAQRRRRVFVVGYFGDWRRAAAVLFERHSLSGNPAPRRETGQRPAPTISARPSGGGGLGTDFDLDGGLVAHTLKGEGFDAGEDGTGRGTPLVPVAYRTAGDGAAYEEGDLTAPLTTGTDSSANVVAYSIMPMNSGRNFKARPVDVAQPLMAGGPVSGNQGGDFVVAPLAPVAFAIQERAVSENLEAGPGGKGFYPELGYTLEARNKVQAVAFALRGRDGGNMPELGGAVSNALRTPGGGASVPMVASTAVRRLTPVECERLQGFADGYTDIAWRGKPSAPDGPRYKALGNSMAVPCMRWIGERIAAVEALSLGSAA